MANYNPKQAWHRGTAIEVEPGSTVQEQLDLAGLNWEVKLSPTMYAANGEIQVVPGLFSAHRSDTGAFIDTYAKREPWQNADIVGAFNSFCEEADLPMTHLGSLDGGNEIYAAAKLPETIAPSRSVGDLTELFLLLEDGHKNGTGLNVSVYANRLICTNGMKKPVRVSKRGISHVKAFNSARIQGVIAAAHSFIQSKQEEVDRLADVNIDKAEAALQLIAAFGDPKQPVHNQPSIVKTCLRLFGGAGKGSNELSSYNTAYGLLQSVTEYYNHHAKKRGTLEQQFQSVLSGGRANHMQKFERQVVSCYL